MGFLSAILGGVVRPFITPLSGPRSAGVGATPNVARTAVERVDVLFTSDEERLDKQAVLARIPSCLIPPTPAPTG